MNDFFSGLNPESLERLAPFERQSRVSGGTLIFTEGDAAECFYRLVSGSVRLFRSSGDGREVTIHLVQPGDLFAEIVLFERDTYPVSAVAEEESLLVAIERGAVHQLLDDPAFRNDFIVDLVSKIRFLSERLYVLTTMDVRQRLLRFLSTRYGPGPVLRCDLSKQETATAICVRPETLSRTLRALEAEGILTWKGRTITLHAAQSR